MNKIICCFVVLVAFQACSQSDSSEGATVYQTGFEELDTTKWVVESETDTDWEDLYGDGCMDIDVPKGITIWFDEKLERDVIIEFEVEVVKAGGPNDRASDLNCFWMATDPENPDDFFERKDWRGGVFWRYYSLNLYYVGLGGHDNTKTRLRKYHGTADPQPEVIKEYTEPEYLITPNERSTIRIVCRGNLTQYFYNREKLYELEEENPYDSGYFGFRTVNNHMRVHSFKVYKSK